MRIAECLVVLLAGGVAAAQAWAQASLIKAGAVEVE